MVTLNVDFVIRTFEVGCLHCVFARLVILLFLQVNRTVFVLCFFFLLVLENCHIGSQARVNFSLLLIIPPLPSLLVRRLPILLFCCNLPTRLDHLLVPIFHLAGPFVVVQYSLTARFIQVDFSRNHAARFPLLILLRDLGDRRKIGEWSRCLITDIFIDLWTANGDWLGLLDTDLLIQSLEFLFAVDLFEQFLARKFGLF